MSVAILAQVLLTRGFDCCSQSILGNLLSNILTDCRRGLLVTASCAMHDYRWIEIPLPNYRWLPPALSQGSSPPRHICVTSVRDEFQSHAVRLDARDLLKQHLLGRLHMDPTHDGRHCSIWKFLLSAEEADVQHAWREVGLVLGEWIATTDGARLHCFCKQGRHRSLAWAIAVAIVCTYAGVQVRLWYLDSSNNRNSSRLCRRSHCTCNSFYAEDVDPSDLRMIESLREGIIDLMDLHNRGPFLTLAESGCSDGSKDFEVLEELEIWIDHYNPCEYANGEQVEACRE